jgi:hypothetical protein
MTVHHLDEVLDAKAASAPAAPATPVPAASVEGWRAIPQARSCVWVPDYTTLPATWRLPERNVSQDCKVHGNEGEAA